MKKRAEQLCSERYLRAYAQTRRRDDLRPRQKKVAGMDNKDLRTHRGCTTRVKGIVHLTDQTTNIGQALYIL
jgi:hypothetical protein